MSQPYDNADEAIPYASGMYLRDLFAGFALIGLVDRDSAHWTPDVEKVAKHCYDYADALLEAREVE